MLKLKWFSWLFFPSLLIPISNALGYDDSAVLPSGVYCYRTSPNFIFRDTSSSCGAQPFCTVPMLCYLSSGQYVGGSVATCRALDFQGSSQCPTLQGCVDDNRQEYINAGDRFVSRPTPTPYPIRIPPIDQPQVPPVTIPPIPGVGKDCTTDTNKWGYPSVCHCNDFELVYDAKTGRCKNIGYSQQGAHE